MLPYQQQYTPIQPRQNNQTNQNLNSVGLPEMYMDLSPKQKLSVVKLIGVRDTMLYAGMVDKVNKRKSVQRRVLVITDKAILNIDPDTGILSSLNFCSQTNGYSLRRRININKLIGATISINPTSEKEQFLIHVEGERDYLFNGGQKRERIIRSLVNAHFLNSTSPFILYCREEADLSKFHITSDDDKKNKKPQEGRILVSQDMMKNGLSWIIFNRHNLAGNPNAVGNMNNGPNGPSSQPTQSFPTGASYPGPYNGPNNGSNNMPGPYPQIQGSYPNNGEAYQPHGVPNNYNQGGYYPPGSQNYPTGQQNYPSGPQSYQPYPQAQGPSTGNPFQQFFAPINPQNQGYGGQNQGYGGQGYNNGAYGGQQNVNTTPNNNQNAFQAECLPINMDVQIKTNFEPTNQNQGQGYNQYNGNYPYQNQGGARNF